MEILTVFLLIVVVVLLVVVIFLILRTSRQSNLNGLSQELYKKIQPENQMIREIIMQQQKIQSESSLELSSALKDSLHSMGIELLKNNSEAQSKMQDARCYCSCLRGNTKRK